MLTTLTLFGLLMVFGLMLGAEASDGDAAPAEDEDEKELIASVGADATAKPKPKEEPEDDDESDDEADEGDDEADDEEKADDAATGADAGASTVSGGSGGDKPVPEVAAPAPTAGSDEPTGVVGLPDAEIAADPIIKRLDSAIEKIEKNELIEDYEKDQKIAALLEQKEGRVAKLTEAATKTENTFRNNKARELGITRAQLDTAWAEALTESHKIIGKFSYDAAMMVLAQKAQAIKAKAPKNGHSTPAPKPAPPKAVAPTPITPKGARVAPPGAAVPPPPKKLSDEQQLVEDVRREQKAGVRL